ncbi:MAG: hypothetical protein DCF25_03015 [Leptolyngbya foveolarum]|uniref:Uncharacterized protein n=1 Tax=Leptolyngbya foveolarum TaxID=47253 RepID=A0A2W4ULK2_9CYAN|nr:MAG: hypothetical protein DCF25_03015 [Leptolyngbya foveolarum]
MIQTIEAVVDPDGNIRLTEPIKLSTSRRALVTILDEVPATQASETALMSEAVLAEDWLQPEEEAAWLHLQQMQSS